MNNYRRTTNRKYEKQDAVKTNIYNLQLTFNNEGCFTFKLLNFITIYA